MAHAWGTVRVFIISTFRDMQAERDHLVRQIFPELKERCHREHINLIDIDLRWGVSEQDAREGKTLDICLDEIDSVRPFFLGLLGHRYGDIPEGHHHSITAREIYHGVLHGNVPGRVVDLRKIIENKLGNKALSNEQKECLERNYQWNPDREKYILTPDVSATDLKTLASVFEKYTVYHKDRSYFFFRDEKLTRSLAGNNSGDFFEGRKEERDKLDALKQAIVDSGLPVQRYQDIEQFGHMVLETLWERIERETEVIVEKPRDWLEEERELHYLFMADRTRRFVGRRELLSRMHAFSEMYDQHSLLIITGAPGSGKSALMAGFTEEAIHYHPSWLIIPHFVGASPASTNLCRMLRRFCAELHRALGINDELPEEPKKLLTLFPKILAKVTGNCQVLIIIDAIDKLEKSDTVRSLSWFPRTLTANVRFVISTCEGKACDALPVRATKSQVEQVRGLSRLEIRELVKVYLEEIRHEFPHPQVEAQFLARVEEGNPLYIRVALEELRIFGKFEELENRIRRLPDNVTDLFAQVLERIENDFEPALVRDCLAFIACGRQGMTAEELQTLLRHHSPKLDPDVEPVKLPDLIWGRLYRSLSAYLFERSGVIDFFHSQFKAAVEKRYLGEDAVRARVHRTIADYFESRWREPYPRALDELPRQRMRASDWAGLERILRDLTFIEAKASAGMTVDLVADYNAALSSEGFPTQTDIPDFARFVTAQRHVIEGNPTLMFQLAINEPDATPQAQAAEKLFEAGQVTGPFFRWINKPQAVSACMLTLIGHRGGVTSFALSPDGSCIVSASRDNHLKLWDTKTGAELSTFHGHRATVKSCDFSPDGHRIVSIDSNKIMKLWDAQTGEEVATLIDRMWLVSVGNRIVSATCDETRKIFESGLGYIHATEEDHKDAVLACDFSPDGHRLVSTYLDTTLKLWDAETGTELATLAGHNQSVIACAFSPDGRRIVSASRDGTLKMWDAETGAELATLSDQLTTLVDRWDPVAMCAFSPDGSRIVVAFRAFALMLWDANTGAELAYMMSHTWWVLACAISPDSSRIVSASWDKTLKIWDAHTGAELATLTGHSERVTACDYSPDCSLIVSASEDKTLKIWDAQTGAELATLTGHSEEVTACTFTADGRRIVSASMDETLKFWDVRAGIEFPSHATHKGKVGACAYSPEGRYIVSASKDRTLKIWNAGTGAELATLAGHDQSVTACAYSPDGRRIVSASWDNTLKIWNAQTGAELATLIGHSEVVKACAFSPDGSRIVSASGDKTLKLWDALTGAECAALTGHSDEVTACAFTPDGSRIVSASEDTTLKIWDAQTGIAVSMIAGHSGWVCALAFSPDGSRFVSASEDHTLVIWDAQTGVPQQALIGHRDEVYACTFSLDGRRIVSASHDSTLKIWDASSGKELATVFAGHINLDESAFSLDGSRFVSASRDNTLELWDTQKGTKLATFECQTETVTACAMSPDGSRIVSASKNNTLKLWDAQTGSESATLTGHSARVTACNFSPDGSRLVSASEDKTLKIWDAQTGAERATLTGHSANATACAFSPDGSRLVSASEDGLLKLWDAHTGAELATLTGHTDKVRSCIFAPDGSRIVSASEDNTMMMWNAKTGAALATLAAGHASRVLALAVSPDGSRIASASEDKTLKLWDAQTGAVKATLVGHIINVTSCAFSPDGRRIISTSEDKTIRLWDAQTGAEVLRYELGSDGEAIAWSPRGDTFAAGDNIGHLLILRLQNLSLGPILVTPWQQKSCLHFGCPLCREWSEAAASVISTVIACPHCGGSLKINDFTIKADWRPVAAAWKAMANFYATDTYEP